MHFNDQCALHKVVVIMCSKNFFPPSNWKPSTNVHHELEVYAPKSCCIRVCQKPPKPSQPASVQQCWACFVGNPPPPHWQRRMAVVVGGVGTLLIKAFSPHDSKRELWQPTRVEGDVLSQRLFCWRQGKGSQILKIPRILKSHLPTTVGLHRQVGVCVSLRVSAEVELGEMQIN